METFPEYHKSGTIQLLLIADKFKKLLFFLILNFNLTYAQKIDSLTSLLATGTDVEKCRILTELAYEYLDIDNSLSLEHSSKAFNIAKENRDTLLIVETGRIKSQAFDRLGKVDSTIFLLIEILPYANEKNLVNDIAKIFNLLGLSYTYKAEYAKALQYHFQSLELRENLGDVGSISVSLNNIGLVYYKMRAYDKALRFYQKSLNLKNEVGILDVGTLLVNISLCYAHLNDYKQADNFVERAFKTCTGHCSKELLMYGFYSCGVRSAGLKNFKKAESEFLRSYFLSKELDDKRLLLDNIIYLSKIYISSNQLKLAEKYLQQTQELIKQGIPYNLELIKVYSELFSLYRKSKNYEKVSTYQGLYIQLKDSIYSDELTRNLMQVEADYLERENKAKIISQSKIMALNDEIIFRQRIINACVIVVALLLTAMTFILLIRNRYKKKMNDLLELKVKERTLELEQNQSALHNAIMEQAFFLEKLSSEVKSSLASVKGLCSLGLREMTDSEAKSYFNRILNTSDRLLGVVNLPKRDQAG